jgi:hypothetical protein
MARQWLWHECDIGDFFELVEEPYLKDGESYSTRTGCR